MTNLSPILKMTALIIAATVACSPKPVEQPAADIQLFEITSDIVDVAITDAAIPADVTADAIDTIDVPVAEKDEQDQTIADQPDETVAADTEVATPDVEVAPEGCAIEVDLSSNAAVSGGELRIKLLTQTILESANIMDVMNAPTLLTTAMPVLPAKLKIAMPKGSWTLMALQFVGDNPQGVAIPCAQKQPQYVTCNGGAQTLKMVFHAGFNGLASLCADDIVVEPPTGAWIKPKITVQTPPTALGGAHLLQGQVAAKHFWVAGSQDGFVNFEFPGTTPPPDMANWFTTKTPFCNRITAQGNYLYCASRVAFVQVQQLSDLGVAQGQPTVVNLAKGLTTEGLAAQGNVVYVTAHSNGLQGFSAQAPFSKLTVTAPEFKDAWDVAALGSKQLVVANGTQGIAILDVSADPLVPKAIGSLALPGRAVFLHVDGTLLAVGALSGGAHVVDLSLPTAPKLLGTLPVPGLAYGVTFHQNRLVVAAGHHLLIADVPSSPSNTPLFARGGVASFSYVMDADAFGADLLSAEFSQVRQLQIDAPPKDSQPVLLVPTKMFSGVTKVNQPMSGTLTLTNAGAKVLNIDKMQWFEALPNGAQKTLNGPWVLAPGQTQQIVLTVPKTAQGVLNHELHVFSDDPALPEFPIQWIETTSLQPGEDLPPLEYADANKKLVNVNGLIKGKVGVVLVAAPTCPVAFLALAAASQDLAPLIASGKVAAAALTPWDEPEVPEASILLYPFPMLYTPLTTKDNHSSSGLLDSILSQFVGWGPPMPLVYVIGKDGKIITAGWGYDSKIVLSTINKALQ